MTLFGAMSLTIATLLHAVNELGRLSPNVSVSPTFRPYEDKRFTPK